MLLLSSARAYVAFVLREPAAAPSDSLPLHHFAPHYWLHLAACVAFFVVLNAAVVPRLLRASWRGWESLPPATRTMATAYVCALAHHVVVVPLGFAAIVHEVRGGGPMPAATLALVAPFATGYLVADTLFVSIPDALRGDFQYLLHHVLGIALAVGALRVPLGTMRWAPHLLVCELSTFGLFAVWALGKASRTSRAYTASMAFFAVTFTLTRVVNLPLVAYAVVTNPRDAAALGVPGCVVLVLIVAMQFFWWSKIVAMAAVALGCAPARAAGGDAAPAPAKREPLAAAKREPPAGGALPAVAAAVAAVVGTSTPSSASVSPRSPTSPRRGGGLPRTRVAE